MERMKFTRKFLMFVTIAGLLSMFSFGQAASTTTTNKDSSKSSAMGSDMKSDTKASDTNVAKASMVDINSATKDELTALPGIGDAYAQKIIGGCPYSNKAQLLRTADGPKAAYEQV